MDSPFIHEAQLQEPADGKVRCLTCERRCLLADGGVGRCRTRQNWGGTLYTLIYGLVSSLSANPIEKKPLHHFFPGTVALTSGAWSCNFACPWYRTRNPVRKQGESISSLSWALVPARWLITCVSLETKEAPLWMFHNRGLIARAIPTGPAGEEGDVHLGESVC
jgi:hypothetical protein